MEAPAFTVDETSHDSTARAPARHLSQELFSSPSARWKDPANLADPRSLSPLGIACCGQCILGLHIFIPGDSAWLSSWWDDGTEVDPAVVSRKHACTRITPSPLPIRENEESSSVNSQIPTKVHILRYVGSSLALHSAQQA